MSTGMAFRGFTTKKGNQMFTSDLSIVSSTGLTALSDKLYKELDTVAPDPRTRDRYDDLVEEIEFRDDSCMGGCSCNGRGDDVQGS